MKHVVAVVVVAGFGCGPSQQSVREDDLCPVRTTPVPPARQLDQDAIYAGVCAVRHRIEACGVHFPIRGTVKIRAVVLPSGIIDSLEILAAPGTGIATCVARAVRDATFDATELGGSFSYPFVFL